MTSPIEEVTVKCPRCVGTYSTWHRASVNVELDPGLNDPAYLEQAATGKCPSCGHIVELGLLTVDGDVWTVR